MSLKFVSRVTCHFDFLQKQFSSTLLPCSSSFHVSSSAAPLRQRQTSSSSDVLHRRQTPRKGSKYEPVDLATSKAYLKSEAFAKTYEGLPVWHETLYRRNFQGRYNPVKTRPRCVMRGVLVGNPCPICRDNHLVLHHENVDLLKQFVEDQTGEVITTMKTNICQHQHERLQIAVGRARDRGLLEMRVPQRQYDYADFYPKELLVEVNYEDVLSPEEKSFLSRTRDVAERQLGRNDIRVDEDYEDVRDDGSDDDSDLD